MRTSTLTRTPFLAALCIAIASHASSAQDVQYKSVTSLDMGTGMNLALKVARASEVAQTTYIKGKKMRTEDDHSATIFDLDRGRVIIVDNGEKTYISAPISQMTAAFSQMAAGANVRAEKGTATATARDSAGNKADFTFHVATEPTSERAEVNGFDAQRVFATIETDMKVTPEGETQAQDAGKLVILIDSWNAKNGPAYAATNTFQQAMAKEMRDQFASGVGGMSAALAANPQLGEAMKKAAAEQKKLEGIAVKSTVHFVVVPPSMPFNRDVAINPPESGAGGLAKKAVGGMLGGMLGRAKPEEKKPEVKQSTLMKMTTEIRDVQTTSLPASLFEPPAGYKEIPFTAATTSTTKKK